MSNNNNYNGSGELGPWIGIVICMVIFWPLGLFLLLRKLQSYAKRSNSKQTYTHTAPAASAAGVGGSAVKSDKQKRAPKNEKDAGPRSDKLVPLILLLVAIVLVIYGAKGIYESARDMAIYGADSYNIWDMIRSAFFCVGGFVSFTMRGVFQRRSRKFKKFQTLVGKRKVVPVQDIASAVGVTEKSARKTLQTMIDDGWFGQGAYLDVGLNSLVMSADAAEAARRAAPPPEAERAPGAVSQYMAIIQELRDLNITIIDESISNKIDRIEYVTAQIFRTVEENPAKQPQIRRFMSYYLPTTLKLLHSYATLEKQGIQGENISGAKQNIDGILDTLSKGFEQQLDMLFKSDVIDISADISVLENMMKQDGLTESGFQIPEDGPGQMMSQYPSP